MSWNNTEKERPKTEHHRGAMLRRQWQIYGLLKRNTRGMTAQQISREIGTPYRTIIRDLDVMSGVMPIYYDVQIMGKHDRGREFLWKVSREAL